MSVVDLVASLRAEGIRFFHSKDYSRALASIEEFLEVDAGDHDILNVKAQVLDSLGRSAEALSCVDRCLQFEPNNAGDLGNRALLLTKLMRLEEALSCCEQILAMEPKRIDILIKRAQLLHNLHRRDDALQCAHQAVALGPTDLTALNMRGMILDEMGRRDDALADFVAVLTIDPTYSAALTNRGIIHGRGGQFREALACYDQSLSIDPHQANAIYNRAVVRLVLGDWRQGFADFESRWHLFPHEARRLTRLAPVWTGREDLSKKTILLHHEQGFGDTLQFARYAGLVKELGPRVILAVPAGLKTLMETLAGSPQIVSEGEPIPVHDYHCPLMSLPLAFGTTPNNVPAPIPYLRADPASSQRWAERLGKGKRPRIGVVWSGRQFPPINHARDMSFKTLRPLFSLDAEFVCLHTEVHDEERIAVAATANLFWLGQELKDFADTAALVESLDLVISVDSAVAHLAGALGKPIWLMNRYASCWRWLLDRTDSPWYPTMRVFRQQSLGDWAGVVQEVLCEAKLFVDGRDGRRQNRNSSLGAGTRPQAETSKALQQALDQHNRGELVAAMYSYRCILDVDSKQFEALHYLGIALAQSGRYQEALTPLSKALQIQPANGAVHNHFGNALAGLSRYAEAIESYERAIECNSEFADAHYNCGVAWMEAGRQDLAIQCYSKAITLAPLYAQAHNNRGSILADLGDTAEALLAYQRAIKANPLFADSLINRSNLLRRLHRYEEAVEGAERAIQCAPLSADAHNARGAALADMGKHLEAQESYQRSIAIDPTHAEAHWNSGLIKLAHGDFQTGWKLYEHRWEVKSLKLVRPSPNVALWTGTQSIDRKVILLHAEQGYGDTIQFCRFSEALAARGARVILSVPESLRTLLTCVPGVDRVVAQGSAPPVDLQCSLMSLPGALKVDEKALAHSVPYFRAEKSSIKKWADRLDPRNKAARIGLAWAGRLTHANDFNRSIPLQILLPITRYQCEWISLQKEVRATDEAWLAAAPEIARLGEEITDFADAAALIENLDLVITVDTAIAHLAGAMGKPVWILLPHVADWRWLRDREDSPWYPSARLFRQSARADWTSVMDRIVFSLQHEFGVALPALGNSTVHRSGSRSFQH
jgi:tetratricopeptide (TPR) repeat protein